jgi:hypothetical protein
MIEWTNDLREICVSRESKRQLNHFLSQSLRAIKAQQFDGHEKSLLRVKDRERERKWCLSERMK